MIRNGYVTFGVFNRIDKVSDPALALWSRLMQALPGSRLVIKHEATGAILFLGRVEDPTRE